MSHLIRFLRNKRMRLGLALLFLVFASVLWVQNRPTDDGPAAWVTDRSVEVEKVSFDTLLAQLEQLKEGDRIAISPDRILIERRESDESAARYSADITTSMHSVIPGLLEGSKATIVFQSREDNSGAYVALEVMRITLMIGLIGVMLYFLRRSISGNNQSSHALVQAADLKEGLKDVAGLDVASEEIQEVIHLLKNPANAERYGARMPKGLLLSGPPGTGKTLLARAMAKEAGVSFLSIDASGLNQLFMGMGAMKVRRAFALARKNAPCIVFIDEIDAMGRRGMGDGGVDQEKGATINALLTELDGIKASNGLFLIGATNLPERLDEALVRPGRIDRKLHVNLPDRQGRVAILKVHSRDLKLADDVSLDEIAGTTPGLAGAALASMCNEAALAAMRDGRETVTAADFAQARDRQLLGQSGNKLTLSDEERRITAWHEAGHALVATLLDDTDPIERVTIIPQGGALGFVLQVPDQDRHMQTRGRLAARMKILAAGRAAEILKFGHDGATTGAASDIDVLTRIATEMVTRFGMGETGFLALGHVPGLLQSRTVQREIKKLSDEAVRGATELLEAHRDKLDLLAEALLIRDVIKGDQIRSLIGLEETAAAA